jgi:hypothetical protein
VGRDPDRGGLGAIAGGVAALHHRPGRPPVACVVWPLPILPESVALAAGAPAWLVAATASCGGFGLAIHVALWFTVFQREVPEHAQSRVASYDAFGSFVLTPLGATIAGPGRLRYRNIRRPVTDGGGNTRL